VHNNNNNNIGIICRSDILSRHVLNTLEFPLRCWRRKRSLRFSAQLAELIV